MTIEDQPINDVLWVPRETVHANDWNPNKVAPPEMRLLELSLLEDGWTQPIVASEEKPDEFEVVDGFHRWTISERKKVAALTDGFVPIVLTRNRGPEQRRLSTIRHNRARGTHAVIPMAEIVTTLVELGIEPTEIMKRLGMEEEEVSRLLDRGNMLERASVEDFGEAWSPAVSVRDPGSGDDG